MAEPGYMYSHLLRFGSQERLRALSESERAALLAQVAGSPATELNWRAVLELMIGWPMNQDRDDALSRADQLLEKWPDSLRKTTTAWKHLFRSGRQGAEIAELAQLVRTLEIYKRDAKGNSEMISIAGSPFLRNLRHLVSIDNSLDTKGIQALATSRHLQNLESLVLHEEVLSAEAMSVMGRSANLRGLKKLTITGASVSEGGLTSLLSAGLGVSLSQLELCDDALDDAAAASLARRSDLRGLKRLSLRENRIGYPGARSLLESPGLQDLAELNLEKNRVSAQEETALRARLQGRKLRLLL